MKKLVDKMENESYEMSRSQNRKKKKGCRGCLWPILIIGLIVGGIIFYAYMQLRSTTDVIQTDVNEEVETHESRTSNNVALDGNTPVSILLLGLDTGDMGRNSRGLSDTIMVMTVNPNTNRTTLTSIPRDTRTEIIGKGFDDKINHAHSFGGPSMTINTVQNFLDIPIDYFVSVNMAGIQQIVDAVDGITVTPPMSFKQGPYSFVEEQQTKMDGAQTLAYSRMRYEDPQGDYGRQTRQRQVVSATLSKVASFDSILNYQSVLASMEDNVLTNLSFDNMVSLFMNYRSSLENFEETQIRGYGTQIDGIYYEIIEEEEVQAVSAQLRKELELDE